jgi:hypothetical protein
LITVEIRKTDTFAKWLDSLNDIRARARILVRIERLAEGNFGVLRLLAKAFQKRFRQIDKRSNKPLEKTGTACAVYRMGLMVSAKRIACCSAQTFGPGNRD